MEVPPPLPLATDRPPYDYMASPSLSLFARPGVTGIRIKRVPRLVRQRVGALVSYTDGPLDLEISLETGPSVLWDGVIIPDCGDAPDALGRDANALEFLELQYRHGKPLLALGSGVELLKAAKIPRRLPHGVQDPGVIEVESSDAAEGLESFIAALAGYRVYAREIDPARV